MATKPNNLILNTDAPQSGNIVLAYPLNEGAGNDTVLNYGSYGSDWDLSLVGGEGAGGYQWVTTEGGGISIFNGGDGIQSLVPATKTFTEGTIILRVSNLPSPAAARVLTSIGFGGDNFHRLNIRYLTDPALYLSFWGDPGIKSISIAGALSDARTYNIIARFGGGGTDKGALDLIDDDSPPNTGSVTDTDAAFTQNLELNSGADRIEFPNDVSLVGYNLVLFDKYLSDAQVAQYQAEPYLMYIDSTSLLTSDAVSTDITRVVQTRSSSHIGDAIPRDYTEINAPSNNASITQYQLVRAHLSFDDPEIFLSSEKGYANAANITEITANRLRIILPFASYYKVRIRQLVDGSWTSWGSPTTFRVRDKDYRKGNTTRKNPTIRYTSRGATVNNTVVRD